MREHERKQGESRSPDSHGAQDGQSAVFEERYEGCPLHAAEDPGDLKNEIRKKSQRVGPNKNLAQRIEDRASRAKDESAEDTCADGCE